DNKWWAYIVAQDLHPLRWMLSHLLRQVFTVVGNPRHSQTDIEYSLDKYWELSTLDSKKWIGAFGEVRDISDFPSET
ncbi:MAG: hypothetical protein AAGF24_11940, partial [Cyanobacteria bacterium P01_H01_bin.121]